MMNAVLKPRKQVSINPELLHTAYNTGGAAPHKAASAIKYIPNPVGVESCRGHLQRVCYFAVSGRGFLACPLPRVPKLSHVLVLGLQGFKINTMLSAPATVATAVAPAGAVMKPYVLADPRAYADVAGGGAGVADKRLASHVPVAYRKPHIKVFLVSTT